MLVFAIILALISVIIVIISLIMAPESNAFSGALVGSSDLELFRSSKELGFRKFLKWMMFILGFILLITSV